MLVLMIVTSLNVQDEMILLLVENPEARKQHQHAHGHADQILGDSGESAVNDQLAHEVDIVEHRVKLHQPERKIRQDIHRVENRGEIRPGQNEHAVEMRDIAEIHRQRGEHRAQTDRKQERIKNRNRHQQQRRMERRARDDHHDKHRDERKAEVHQRVSISDLTKEEEIDKFIYCLKEVLDSIKKQR